LKFKVDAIPTVLSGFLEKCRAVDEGAMFKIPISRI